MNWKQRIKKDLDDWIEAAVEAKANRKAREAARPTDENSLDALFATWAKEGPPVAVQDFGRGLQGWEFDDSYGSRCSIQDSSNADANHIWLGVTRNFEGHACTRMHLTQERVKQLLPLLVFFARFGYLPRE